MNKTLAIIKPDVVEREKVFDIIDRIIEEGFVVLQQKEVHLTKSQAAEFYKEHVGKPFFEKLISFMTRSPCIVLCLGKNNAVIEWRKLIGSKDAQGSLRFLYGTDSTQNAVHGSDSDLSAIREIKFFFPKIQTDTFFNVAQGKQRTKEYIETHLNDLLVKGLTKLAKEKPINPINWLSYWLLENNPNNAIVVEKDDQQ